PEGDGRGRCHTGSDRGRRLLRQPYRGRQRRLRVAVGAPALLRPALRFGVGAHSGQREVADRANAPAQCQICADGRPDHQRNGGAGTPGGGGGPSPTPASQPPRRKRERAVLGGGARPPTPPPGAPANGRHPGAITAATISSTSSRTISTA